MSSRIVKSPAGERIEIVSDADWIAASGGTERGLRQWNGGTKRFVIADLWNRGPVVDEKGGRATALLWDRMGEHYGEEVDTQPTSFNGLHNDNPLMFKRTTNGKRTYYIGLLALPESWYGYLQADEQERAKARRARERELAKETEAKAAKDAELAEAAAAEVTTWKKTEPLTDEQIVTERPDPSPESDAEFERLIQGIELDAPTIYDIEPPLEISIASQVAMSLLTTCVEIISAGSSTAIDERVRKLQGDLNDALGKLSQRLEDNDRLRRQIRQAGDEIVALRHERDGLRSRLRATEANLTAALKGDAVMAINGEIQKRVESIMRAAPQPKGEE